MKHLVKVKFLRADIFEKYFNQNYLVNNPHIVHGLESEYIVFKDQVEDNDAVTARNNILLLIKRELLSKEEFIGMDIQITHTEQMLPYNLWVHLNTLENRTICEVIETSLIED